MGLNRAAGRPVHGRRATGQADDAAGDGAREGIPEHADASDAADPTEGTGATGHVDGADRAAVERLLGRPPQGDFTVVVRHADGSPLVIRNAPLLHDGTPMPTRYWLVGEPERARVGRLEAAGGVAAAAAAVDPDELAEAHRRYAAERDAALPPGHSGPAPSDGVGGTRRGVKCLHAHYAWHLVGGDDPVGRWVAERLAERLAERPAERPAERLAERLAERPAERLGEGERPGDEPG